MEYCQTSPSKREKRNFGICNTLRCQINEWTRLFFYTLPLIDFSSHAKNKNKKTLTYHTPPFQAKHGEAAYPQEAWLEDQYRRHSSLPPMMTQRDPKMNFTPNNDIDNKTGTANVAYVETNEQV